LFFYQPGKKCAFFFLARFSPISNQSNTVGQLLQGSGLPWLSHSHAMFTTKSGRVVLFQHLPTYKTAMQVKLTSYDTKTSPLYHMASGHCTDLTHACLTYRHVCCKLVGLTKRWVLVLQTVQHI